MKFWLCLLVFLLTCSIGAQAQKNDYVWLAGYGSEGGFDTAYNKWFGISQLDFNQQPVAFSRDSLNMYFDRANSSISDKDGNLLFYTNGVKINNRLDELIENSDTLGSVYFLFDFTANYYEGYRNNMMHLILPNPRELLQYDMFWTFIDSVAGSNGVDIEAGSLIRTHIDIGANFGAGSVTSKWDTVFKHPIAATIAAIKHANGRDWWICTYRESSNCYDLLLYNGSNNISLRQECGGYQYTHGAIGINRFSANGQYFMSATSDGHVNFFSFDRCHGTLTLLEDVYLPEVVTNNGWLPYGCEFSPNGRYAYLCISHKLYQFDVLADTIGNSKTTIATYNSTLGPFSHTYYHAQLAPDGKIYINSGSTTYHVAVIQNPDNAGAACNFKDTTELPTWISGLPHYPNYRLGALPGSPCDTLTGLNDIARAEKEKLLKVFPNPATNFITIDYGFTDWNKGEVSLEITNELGQMVHQQPVPMYSGFQKIEVQNFAPGMYTAFIKRKGQVVATAKFAKQ